MMKSWRCKGCGSHLGKVTRNGSDVHQLLLFREAVDTDQKEFPDVEVIAVVEGYAADVICSVCGVARTWVPGREAIEKLLVGAGVEQDQIDKLFSEKEL